MPQEGRCAQGQGPHLAPLRWWGLTVLGRSARQPYGVAVTPPGNGFGKRASTESQMLRLGHADRTILERWVRARTSAQRLVMRSRIVLLLADGLSARRRP